jgi:hypothetical protein
LIWLQQANCFEPVTAVTWGPALAAANTLASGSCGLTDKSKAGDWRLPNVRELHSLIDFGFINPALSNAAGTGHWTEGDAFSSVQFDAYWSSTSEVGFQNPNAYIVILGNGLIFEADKVNRTARVWPVRGGK